MRKLSLKALWNSATFSTWAYQVAMSLQVFLIAPIVLRHFNQTEVSAWYLFSSLNVFGTIVMLRVTMTYSRTIAIATAGRDNEAQPDWREINRVVSTMAVFQIGLVVLNIGVAGILGYIGLRPLVMDYQNAAEIYLSFFIHQLGSVGTFYVSRYHAVLFGLNAVAVSNRWSVITIVVGLAAVAVSIVLGGGIVCATALNAIIAPLGGLLARASLLKWGQGRLTCLDTFRLHKDIATVATGPILRSIIVQLATMGVGPLAAVLIARQGNAEIAASFNFSFRMLVSIEQVGMVPYFSVQPLVSRWMVEERFSKIHELLRLRGSIALLLMVSAFSVVGFSMPYMLSLIGSSTRAMHLSDWAWLCLGVLVARIYSMLLAPLYAINQITFTRHSVVCALLSVTLIALLLPNYGQWCVGAAILLANIVVFRSQPFVAYRNSLGLRTGFGRFYEGRF